MPADGIKFEAHVCTHTIPSFLWVAGSLPPIMQACRKPILENNTKPAIYSNIIDCNLYERVDAQVTGI